MEFEEYKQNLRQLIDWNTSTGLEARNEATTRLHLIDRLFFECLDWAKEDCTVEEEEGRLYSDYTFFHPARVLIIEAKREGIYFELPEGLKERIYKIDSLFSKNPEIKMAIEQAIKYCQQRGVTIGGVSNGNQLILFIASRNDGVSPMAGKAVIYRSLENIYDNFLEFWQFISKEGIIKKNIEKALVGISVPLLPSKLSIGISDYPGTKNRNSIQAELQLLGDLLLEELITNEEIEEDFLKTTYCTSGALSQYALTSKNILQSRYSLLSDEKVDVPILEPMYTKKGLSSDFSIKEFSRRPILLLGDVGAGKTMFIKNFMKVEAKDIIQDTISIYVDLGSKAALHSDLKRFFIAEIEAILLNQYGIDIIERNFVRGVYNIELKRFEKGIFADLKEASPADYLNKEIEFLNNLVEQRETHLKNSLHHIALGRKKQVVIFMDNVDQRTEQIQEEAFFISQEIAANWDATVFITLRPQTFYQSKISGALTGYHPKAFTIAPPRVDEVILKRLDFAQQIARGERSLSCLNETTRLKLTTLQTYLEILEYSFTNNRELLECIDNISNGNIRTALELITTFIGSGHVDTEKIFRIDSEHTSSNNSQRYLIAAHEFIRAIIFGEHKYFYPSATIITNLFDISEKDPREHFLICICLDYLNSSSSKTEFGFVGSEELIGYLQNVGFNQDQVLRGVMFSVKQRLIETEARKKPTETLSFSQARITSLGVYHLQKLINRFVYHDAIYIDTIIIDAAIRDKMDNKENILDRLERAKQFNKYLDGAWKMVNSNSCGFNWDKFSSELKKNIQEIEEKQLHKENY